MKQVLRFAQIVLFSVLSTPVHAEMPIAPAVVVADNFSLAENRKAGGVLDGTTATQSLSWRAAPAFVFDGDVKDGRLRIAAAGSVSATVAMTPADRFEIELDVRPSAQQKGWIGVGLGGAVTPSTASFTEGVFLILDSAGKGAMLADGTRLKLASKELADAFLPAGPNRLRLVYDAVAGTASGWINGRPIAEGVSLRGFVPTVTRAGFSAFGCDSDSWVDNFSLACVNPRARESAETAIAKPADVYRVLFLGNSITRSLPNAKHQWTYAAGMAASSEGQDYVHQFCAKLGAALADRGLHVESRFLAEHGGRLRACLGRVDEYRPYAPDLVVVQFGENEKPGAGSETFAEDYATLLAEVASLVPKPRVIVCGLWAPRDGTPYQGRTAEVDAAIADAARTQGAGFASVQQYAIDPACRGFGATEGVKWHPNDAGMKGYAEALFTVWKSSASEKPGLAEAAPPPIVGEVSDRALAQAGSEVIAQTFSRITLDQLRTQWAPESVAPWGVDVGEEGLVFEVRTGAEADSMKIKRKLKVEAIRGATVLLSARIRGEQISKKGKPWNGVKIALSVKTPATTLYPQVRPAPEGTFGWTNVSTVVALPSDAESADVYVGLEAVTGKLWIESLAIRVLEQAQPEVAVLNPGGVLFKGHLLPRLRGAMVRTAATEEDLRVLGQEWNANVIRWQLGDLRYKETGLGTPDIDNILDAEIATLDRMLPIGRKFGLHVVIDLHSLSMKPFESAANQDKLVEIWKKLAAHYKGNPVIWGYDIVNEPHIDEWKEGALLWNDLAERVCREIRNIDPATTIIVEPEKWGSPEGLSSLRPVSVSNVVYSIHVYTPSLFTHNRVYDKHQKIYTYPGDIDGTIWNQAELKRTLQPVIDFQKKYGVHIYVGEFSAIRWSPGAAQYVGDLIEICEANDWDWTYHAFREFHGWSVEHGSDMADIAPSATQTDREKVVRSWFDQNRKPAWSGTEADALP